MELDWFFDQWLKTTRKCDYGIESFSGKWISENGLRKYSIKVKLRNHGQIVMPIDFYIYFEDGTYQKVIIPLDLQLKPKKEANAIILPHWFWVNPVYEFELSFDKKVKMVRFGLERFISVKKMDIFMLHLKKGKIISISLKIPMSFL